MLFQVGPCVALLPSLAPLISRILSGSMPSSRASSSTQLSIANEAIGAPSARQPHPCPHDEPRNNPHLYLSTSSAAVLRPFFFAPNLSSPTAAEVGPVPL